jgi:NAD(P)-dependent dehydrogenase (short-subunit alcohol dehydrogenase family)
MDVTASSVLEGRAVVITGAGRGLGRSYALAVAAAGGFVVVNDVDIDQASEVVAQIQLTGGVGVANGESVADPEGARRLIDQSVASFGRLDGLVNNAGLFHAAMPWDEDYTRVRRIVEVNVLGTMYCTIAATRIMKAQGSGAIVNITSGASMGVADTSIYGATKGAVSSFTYDLAIDLRASGIRVNAVSPVAETRMEPPRPLAVARAEPETIAPVVVYLLSDLAEDITGQIVRLTGSELTLVTAPRLRVPPAVRERWTVAAIAEQFRTALRPGLQPVGFAAQTYTGLLP